jgi:hypothetical protein
MPPCELQKLGYICITLYYPAFNKEVSNYGMAASIFFQDLLLQTFQWTGLKKSPHLLICDKWNMKANEDGGSHSGADEDASLLG